VSWLTSPDSDWDNDESSPELEQPRSRGKLIALLVGGWLVVSLVVLLALLVFSGPKSSTKDKTAAKPAPASGASSTANASSSTNLPDGWVQQAADDQTDCAAHSYGQVAAFFAKTPCSSVHRVLATTNQGGRNVVVASYVVTFDSASQARRYNGLVASDGTGNISDLLREGVTYPGGPSKLPSAAFASRQDGQRVVVAEAGYASGASDGNNATLKSVAQQAAAQS
jgi:hypothetical protein